MLTQEKKRQILDEIMHHNGGVLRPEDVVREASNPAHELHGEFEWDDKHAAHAHRLDQARGLITSVRVVVETESRKLETVHYVRDPRLPTSEQGYVSFPQLRTQKELARDAIAAEFGRALGALKRARDLAAALGEDAKVDDVVRRIEELAQEIAPLKAVG